MFVLNTDIFSTPKEITNKETVGTIESSAYTNAGISSEMRLAVLSLTHSLLRGSVLKYLNWMQF